MELAFAAGLPGLRLRTGGVASTFFPCAEGCRYSRCRRRTRPAV